MAGRGRPGTRAGSASSESRSESLSREKALSASTVTLPILRDGTDTMRPKLIASLGLKQKRR